MPTDPQRSLLSVPECARYCKVTRPAIHRAIQKGRIKAWRVGDRWYSTTEELDRYKLTKYTRDFTSTPSGELLFDVSQGSLSCPQVAKIFSSALGRPYPLQKVYHRIYTGLLPAKKVRYYWVVRSQDAANLLQYELDRSTQQDSA